MMSSTLLEKPLMIVAEVLFQQGVVFLVDLRSVQSVVFENGLLGTHLQPLDQLGSSFSRQRLGTLGAAPRPPWPSAIRSARTPAAG
jgi:hypothetical protein